MGHRKGAYRIMVARYEGNRLLGRPRRRWKDNIKIDLQEVEWGGMSWIYLAQDRVSWPTLLNTAMNCRVS
jgi:hypothetical protein